MPVDAPLIVLDPHPALRQKCAHVRPEDDVRSIVAQLNAALAVSKANGRPGIGLAAPQIGLPVRVFVLNGYGAFVNPRLLKTSSEQRVALEGCLSLPAAQVVPVSRPKWAKITAADETGRTRTLKLHGTDARAALHELDHLEGILITDRAAVAA